MLFKQKPSALSIYECSHLYGNIYSYCSYGTRVFPLNSPFDFPILFTSDKQKPNHIFYYGLGALGNFIRTA